MAHVPLGMWCFDKIRLFWPFVVAVWLCIQFLLWSTLERHHQGLDSSLRVHTENNPPELSKRGFAVSKPKHPKLDGIAVGGYTSHKIHQRIKSLAKTGNNENHQAPDLPLDSPPNTTNNDTFHIVFSTDCSGYQHWQGILLYYSARRVNQPGLITRIASGCTPEQQQSIQYEWRQIDPTGKKFQVHFSPSTVIKQRQKQAYKYSNKPGGILHWLQHNTQLDDSTVICLLDPDMILLKPITADLVVSQEHWKVLPRGKNQVEYIDEQGIAQLLRVKFLEKSETSPIPKHVTTGFPVGQHFGIGGAWVQGMAPHAKPAWKNFSKAMVCMEGSPCTTTSELDAAHKYAVGPVYLATVADWKRIAVTWWDFVPKVYPQYPYLLAEMYSFTMAVANLELPFRLFSSYMVTGSDVSSPTEAWSWIDDNLQKQQQQHTVQRTNQSIPQQICSGVDTTTPPDWSHDPKSLALPNTIHYCQRYILDPMHTGNSSFLFAKRKIPHDVFSCAQRRQPVPFDPQRLIADASKKDYWSIADRRSLFVLCHLVPILNWARSVYREEACG